MLDPTPLLLSQAAQEAAIQRTLDEANVDLIVLARYMQVREWVRFHVSRSAAVKIGCC